MAKFPTRVPPAGAVVLQTQPSRLRPRLSYRSVVGIFCSVHSPPITQLHASWERAARSLDRCCCRGLRVVERAAPVASPFLQSVPRNRRGRAAKTAPPLHALPRT
jgi:hypothetical protein